MKDEFKLPGIKTPEIKLINNEMPAQVYERLKKNLDNNQRIYDQINEQKAKEKLEKEQYDAAVLDHLSAIRENTNELKLITELLRSSVSNSEEMLKIYSEMHEIATAKTIEEAQSRYRKFMTSVDELKTDVESTIAISQYAMSIYKTTIEVIKFYIGS